MFIVYIIIYHNTGTQENTQIDETIYQKGQYFILYNGLMIILFVGLK